jgi:hypothetical protein
LRIGCAGANIQEEVRTQIELIKEHFAHLLVEMLTGMHEFDFKVREIRHYFFKTGDFDKIGAGANDNKDFLHGFWVR